jgi:hypothetical protein
MVGMSEESIKSRIISFRLSDNEYLIVQDISRKQGFASVSLFARSATLASCDSSELVHSPVDMEIAGLWRRIEVLTATLEKIAAQAGVLFTPLNAA